MFLNDLATNVVGDSFRHRVLVPLNAGRQVVDSFGDATLHDQVQETDLAKVGDRLGRVGPDVRIN